MSTNEHPQHMLCPKGSDTWCRYWKCKEAGETYDHKNGLPSAVLNEIKPVYRDLAHPRLLEKCLHGGTQNCNESLNNQIWLRCPKTTFCGAKTVQIATYDAVLHYNDGNEGKLKVLENLGIDPGMHTIKTLKILDKERVDRADAALIKATKIHRQLSRSQKRGREDEEDPDYGAGKF